jgi:hypothetical protein
MNDSTEGKFRAFLRSAVTPVTDTELKQDLWPRMLNRLDQSTIRMSWLDWALIAIVPLWLLFFPQLIPMLFYHL